MITKKYPVASLKAASEGEGVVEAIVSVFGNVDNVGDRVMPGAFATTLRDWSDANAKGRYLPFTDTHDWTRAGRIGKVIDAKETDEGLWVKAQLFMNQESARDVFTHIKEGIVGEFSFAYDVIREKKAADQANELLEVNLLDAAAVMHGANAETHLVGVKAELLAKTEADLQKAVDIAQGVLAQVQQAAEPKAGPSKGADTEEPEEAKVSDLPRMHADLFGVEFDALSV